MHFLSAEEVGGDLRRWVNKERFPLFAHIDSFTLYAMGDSGNDITVMSSNMYRKLH